MTSPKGILVLPVHKRSEWEKYWRVVPIISTVSNSSGWQTDLSPFKLGPCNLYGSFVSKNMENGWQYSKVYSTYIRNGKVMPSYWVWAERGWKNPHAVRYPMGKGAKPKFSLWEGDRLDYVPARKRIYGPLYIRAVRETEGFRQVQDIYRKGNGLVLLDYDAYDHRAEGLSLTDVLNNPKKKMGHAFVLAMLLSGDPALNQMVMSDA